MENAQVALAQEISGWYVNAGYYSSCIVQQLI
jgi:hypothetical protein